MASKSGKDGIDALGYIVARITEASRGMFQGMRHPFFYSYSKHIGNISNQAVNSTPITPNL
jgi:hypothetical protein